MANCDKSGNNSGNLGVGLPNDGQGIIRPEQNIPPNISKKEENPYISPAEREAKRYRPLGSFLRTQNKDEAEPELPHDKSRKEGHRLQQPSEPEKKIAVDVSSTENRAHKSLDEVNITQEYSQKTGNEIRSIGNVSEKEDSTIDMNSIPHIKIGDDVFINSTRQVKNSSIDILSSAQRKVDKVVEDTNVHTAKKDSSVVVDTNRETVKTGLSTLVEGKGEYIKKHQTIDAIEPIESAKIDKEYTINASVALRDPKEFDDLWVETKQSKKRDAEVTTSEERDRKEEPTLAKTESSEKFNVSISEPNKKSEKSEQDISSVKQTEKGEQQIDGAPEGEEKSEVAIASTKQKSKQLKEIDNPPNGEEKGEVEISETGSSYKTEKELDNAPAGLEKVLKEIDEVEQHGEKGESNISEESNRTDKTPEKDVNTDAGSSVGSKYSDSQDGNVKYNITTPRSKETTENNYNPSDVLRNKDKADSRDAALTQKEGGSKNIPYTNNKGELVNGTKSISSVRKIKDSSELTGALSSSGFTTETDSQINEVIFNQAKKQEYEEDVLNENYVLKNKNNANRNFVYENQRDGFHGMESNIDPDAQQAQSDSNRGKFVTETTKKTPINIETVIGSPMGPPDQDNENYDFSTYDNTGKIIKASSDAITAESFASIDTTTDELVKSQIYPTESKPIEDSDNAVAYNGRHIVNENLDYTEASLPHTAVKNNTDFDSYQANIAAYSIGIGGRSAIISAKDLTTIIGQENIDFNYTDFSSISIRNEKISNDNFDDNYVFTPHNPTGFNQSTDSHLVTSITAESFGSGDQLNSQVNYINAINYPSKIDGTTSSVEDFASMVYSNYIKEPSTTTDDYNADSSVLNSSTGKKQQSKQQVGYSGNFGTRSNIKPIQDGSAFIDFTNFDIEPENFNISTGAYTAPLITTPLNSVTSNITASGYSNNLKQQVAHTSYNISNFSNRATPTSVITAPDDSTTTDVDESSSRQRLGVGGLKSSVTDAINTADDNPATALTYDGTSQAIYDTAGNIIERVYNNQENSNFSYTISDYSNRATPTTVLTTPDNPDTSVNESVTRQLLGSTGLKASALNSSNTGNTPINVVDDVYATASTYDGLHEDIYNQSGSIIGSVYNNQENTNFDFATFTVIGLTDDALKNAAFTSSFLQVGEEGEINLTSFAPGTYEFGENTYTPGQSSSKYYVDIDSKTVTYKNSDDEVITSSDATLKGFPISRDIVQNDGNNNVWKQLAANTIASSGATSALSAVSNIVSDFQSLSSLNQTFENFTLNNDYGNVLRRALTTELPSVVMSLKNGIDINGASNGVQTVMDGIFDLVGNVGDVVDTAGSYLNHPSLLISKGLRSLLNWDINQFDSGMGDIFTGGGENNVNLLSRGSHGKHGGIGQAFSNNEDKYDINHSFAVTASQWPKDGKALTSLLSIGGTQQNDNYGKNAIRANVKVDGVANTTKISEVAKELKISPAAVYRSLISSYEPISESSSYINQQAAQSIQVIQPAPGHARSISGTTNPPRNRNKTHKIPTKKYLDASNHTEIRNDIAPEFDKATIYEGAGDIYGLPVPQPTHIFEYKTTEVGAKVPPYYVLGSAEKGVGGPLVWGLNDVKLFKESEFSAPADKASRDNITNISFGDMKYISNTFFKSSNTGIVTQKILTTDPHDVVVVYEPGGTSNSMVMTQLNENNNYGGGKSAFILKGTHKQLISDNLRLVTGDINAITYDAAGTEASKKFFVKAINSGAETDVPNHEPMA